MSSRVVFSSLAGLVLLGGFWFLEPETTSSSLIGPHRPPAKPIPAVGDFHESLPPALNIAPMATVKESPRSSETSSAAPAPQALQDGLDQFSSIREIIFPSSDQKRTHQELLQNQALVLSASHYLHENAAFEPNGVLRNEAIDFLLQAARDGNSTATAEIKDLILNPAVENANLPQTQRTLIAGIQGELLYAWTAEAPELLTEIASQLPGPVSQKIWQNVKNIQDNNHLESLAEANTH